MATHVTESAPTWAQVRAAQLLVERARKGLAPQPSERIKALAKATPRPED
ncbi:hypothetical protein [Microlunatus soli]|uniref:Uncharacterized protein n=1 Tax=Microlunatus soli TaxID=630515 RepID=A0A1H1MZ11_9ACTN|nr:hypothetical protein [Microlunatus soli]SDR91857.1 hypothetical protein SAMN04489812_0309 [Microlunatus soli]